LMLDAASGLDGVLSDPALEAIPMELGNSANVVRLRWWTKSDRASQIHTFGDVLPAAYIALNEVGIDMPYPTQVHLFHDQTEDWDGDRARQSEGWPKSPGKKLKPRAARVKQSTSDRQVAS